MDLPPTDATSTLPSEATASAAVVDTAGPSTGEGSGSSSTSAAAPPLSPVAADSTFEGPARPTRNPPQQPRSEMTSFQRPHPPPVPHRSYPPPPRGPSPIPRFLKTLVFIVSVLLGTSAVATWVWSRLLLPRISKSREARQVLAENQLVRIAKLQERVDKLAAVGLLKVPKRPIAPSEASEIEDESALEEKPLLEPMEPDLETRDGPPHASTLLPSDSLRELSALLPSLAPFPRPITLTHTLRSLGSHITTQSLLFSSKTLRTGGVGVGLNSLGDKLGGGGGGAWGGALSEGDREVIGMIGGLRGDVRGMKGLLLSRRTFPSSNPSASPYGSRSGSPQGAAPARWTPPPIRSPNGVVSEGVPSDASGGR